MSPDPESAAWAIRARLTPALSVALEIPLLRSTRSVMAPWTALIGTLDFIRQSENPSKSTAYTSSANKFDFVISRSYPRFRKRAFAATYVSWSLSRVLSETLPFEFGTEGPRHIRSRWRCSWPNSQRQFSTLTQLWFLLSQPHREWKTLSLRTLFTMIDAAMSDTIWFHLI